MAMKKTFLTPETETTCDAMMELLSSSPAVTSDDIGIGYGGIDREGEKDPASRRRHSQWSDEDEEDW